MRLSQLERTPKVLDALLRDLPEADALRNEGPGTWSAFDIVGHLIHADRTDWVPRIRHILEFGESAPFPPFDREGHRNVRAGQSLNRLLDEFAAERAARLAELSALALQPEDLDRRGAHPALGQVTLAQLLATWEVHDLTHLHQLSRVLAAARRDDVGPWSAYLGVLRRHGHSA